MRTRILGAAAALSLVALASAALPTAASAAPRVSETEHRYIVQAVSGSAAKGAAADVAQDGGDVEAVYTRVFAGFSATMTAAQADELEAQSGVTSVVADQKVTVTGTQTSPTWGLDRIDQRATTANKTYKYSTTGAGVTAYVVDSGVRLTHSQFGGRATSGYDFVDDDTNASDCNGHGTHVAGTIGGSTYGVAKAVRIVSVRVLDCNGAGWASDIVASLDWIVAHKGSGPAVVNMSVGAAAFQPLDDAVARTVSAGIAVVVAAGNAGTNACTTSPARAKAAITVGATDAKDTRASWSNYGSCLDVFAPGVDIKSASVDSNSATTTMSGTSMATPHTTGAVARYLQNHQKSTPAQTVAALTTASTKSAVKDAKGSVNRLLYVAPTSTTIFSATTVTTSRSSR